MNKQNKHNCFICGTFATVSNVPDSETIHLFRIPSKSLVKWKTILPGLREFSYICNRHFHQNDYQKGEKNLDSVKYWKLKRNVSPSPSRVQFYSDQSAILPLTSRIRHFQINKEKCIHHSYIMFLLF